VEDRVIDDLSDLARILGVPGRDLRAAIGSPWHRVRPAAYDLDLGPMFVGRDGQSVAILCLASAGDVIGAHGVVTSVGGSLLVGLALSSSLPDGTEGWRLRSARVSLTRGTDARGFLASLHGAVTRAVEQSAIPRDSYRARYSASV
jgi:hypothetical protein